MINLFWTPGIRVSILFLLSFYIYSEKKYTEYISWLASSGWKEKSNRKADSETSLPDIKEYSPEDKKRKSVWAFGSANPDISHLTFCLSI